MMFRQTGILLLVFTTVVWLSVALVQQQRMELAPIDRFQQTLSGIAPFLPIGRNYSLKLQHTPYETQFFVRWVLYNRLMHYPLTTADTTLFIVAKSDTGINKTLGGKQLLWHNEDSAMAYYLICSR
ncbi:MAG: hypothetical protein EBZ77_12225 [Chitinophagia bacterium]|nr:hypothetical protein [Chitinophagia bacterium]